MKSNYYTTVIGNYGVSNFGDDMLMRSVLSCVEKYIPSEEICVIGRKSKYLNEWYPDITFKTTNNYGKLNTKFLIYGGGTQFYSFSSSSSFWSKLKPRIHNLCLNPKHLITKGKMLLNSNKIIAETTAAISIGVGPFNNDDNAKKRTKHKLKNCDWISVRDSTSQKLLDCWGIKNTHLHPDLCFASDLWLNEDINKIRPKCLNNKIGVVFRYWPHSKEGAQYFGPLYEAIKILRNQGFLVQTISFAAAYDKNIIDVLQSKNESVLGWEPNFQSPSDFVKKLLNFDLLISTRAHGVVIGYSLGIPTIAVEIEPKLKLIRESITDGSWGWSKPYDIEDLIRLVNYIILNKNTINANIKKNTFMLEASSEESITKLVNFMKV